MTDARSINALTQSRETAGEHVSGYGMLLVLLLCDRRGDRGDHADRDPGRFDRRGAVDRRGDRPCSCSSCCGFYLLQPNQAAAITLFGNYKGTDRAPACAGSCRG